MNRILLFAFVILSTATIAQNRMTPELLWKLGRVTGLGLSKDKQYVIYAVSTPSVDENKSKRLVYALPVNGGTPVLISNSDSALGNKKISPDGRYTISSEEV